MKKAMRIFLSLMMAAVLVVFCGCEKHDPNLDVLDYTLVAADEAALQELDVYVNLQTLDLRGSDCYDAIESYVASHPQVKVTYDVKLGDTRYSPDVELLKLEDGSYTLEELLSVMKHLPKLAGLALPKTTLTAAQIASVTEQFPNLDINYTLELFGQEVGPDLTELDLSDLTPAQVDENLLEKLRLLSGLTRVQLMKADGTTGFAPVDVKNLMDVMPGVAMDYSFDLFGQTVSTAAERVEFKKVYIGNEGIPEIRAALDILPNCTYFLMDDCGVSNEVMAQLRDDYPNTKVVWRVYWAYFHALTDVEMIHTTDDLNDQNVEVLKYCTDVKYLDIGHNAGLHNIDFVNYMPKLKVAIVVDSWIYDLEPFANCPELEWLEIVACSNITDLSPLANCKNLKGLNMSCVHKVKDLSPLFGLEKMERLYLGNHMVPADMVQSARDAMPNTWITDFARSSSNVSRNYAIGWRLDRKDVRAEWYKEIREIFRYSESFYNGKFG